MYHEERNKHCLLTVKQSLKDGPEWVKLTSYCFVLGDLAIFPLFSSIAWHVSRSPSAYISATNNTASSTCLFLVVDLKEHVGFHPGWCGSVDSVLACKARGCWFDSQSGHMPGLRPKSPVGGTREATTPCFSPSFSLPSPLKMNKQNLKKKKHVRCHSFF